MPSDSIDVARARAWIRAGRKMALVKQQNLLGAMIWEMSGDNGTLMTALDGGLR